MRRNVEAQEFRCVGTSLLRGGSYLGLECGKSVEGKSVGGRSDRGAGRSIRVEGRSVVSRSVVESCVE